MMSQLQRQISQQIHSFQPNRNEFPVIQSPDGKELVVIPADRYHAIKSNDAAWRIVAIGVALGAIAVGLSMFVPAVRSTPEPVIVREQLPPQIVDRNCIAFCGK